MCVTKTIAELKKLTTAEEYLEFFDFAYDQQYVNVNRLHILKQFSLLLDKIDQDFPDLSEQETLSKYREALIQAYEVFQTSSPLETKLFKVFHEKPKNVVLLEDIGVV